MSRPRKLLEEQRGNLTVEQKMQKAAEEAIISGISGDLLEKPPKELRDRYSKATWERIVPDLMQLGVIGNLDRDNLIGYCNAWSWYLECGRKLKRYKDDDDYQRMWLSRQKNAAEEHRKYGRLCGMNLDSRLKAASSKIKSEDDEIKDMFGDI